MLRLPALSALLCALAVAVTGCGSDESTSGGEARSADDTTDSSGSPAEEVKSEPEAGEPAAAKLRSPLSDPAGDVEDGNYKRYPQRGDIDARRVMLTRSGPSLRLVVNLVAAPRPKTRYYYGLLACDKTGNGCTQVDVRREKDGTLESTYYDLEEAMTRPFKGGVRHNGPSLVVTIPLNILTTPPPFRWQVHVAEPGIGSDLADTVPDEAEGESVMAAFD